MTKSKCAIRAFNDVALYWMYMCVTAHTTSYLFVVVVFFRRKFDAPHLCRLLKFAMDRILIDASVSVFSFQWCQFGMCRCPIDFDNLKKYCLFPVETIPISI